MKFLIAVLIAITSITSQANTKDFGKENIGSKPIVVSGTPITTKKEPVLVKGPRVPRFKIFRSNPLRKTLLLSGSDPYFTVDDDSIHVGYRKEQFQKKFKPKYDDDKELSDYVKVRLLVARAKALDIYRKKWTV